MSPPAWEVGQGKKRVTLRQLQTVLYPAATLSSRYCPHVLEPAGRGFIGLQMFGVSVLLHIAFVERSARVKHHAHVVVRMVSPPDTDAC